MQQYLDIRIYEIPGGEGASLQAYDELEHLLEAHEDLLLTVYRGINRANNQWTLTLIDVRNSCVPYQQQINRALEQVQAKPITVAPADIAPLIERFLQRQREMIATQTPLLIKHYPLPKQEYARNSSPHSEKRKKRK